MNNRPKVFSYFNTERYCDRFPQLNLIEEDSLFIPFSVYDILIPVTAGAVDLLNIFERSALKLVDLGYFNSQQISEILCIGKEMAKFIFARLRQLDFINENNEVSEKGKIYLNQSSGETSVEMLPAKVFAIKETGEFIPFVLTDVMVKSDAFWDGKKISVNLGSAGNSYSFSADIIKYDKNSNASTEGIHNRLKKLIKDHNKICASYGRNAIAFVSNMAIDVSTTPETVYLHVRTGLQRGNVDTLLASEGSVINNDIITKYIMQRYPEAKRNILMKASMGKKQEEQGGREYSKYYEIQINLPQTIRGAANKDEQLDKKSTMDDNIRKLYAAIEHSLDYYLRIHRPANSVYSMVDAQDSFDTYAVVLDYAYNMGIHTDGYTGLLSNLDASKLDRYRQTKVPDLYTCLPLAVLSAFNEKDNPFMKMAEEMPYFLKMISRLHSLAARSRHGEDQDMISDEEYQSLTYNVLKFIKLILPDFRIENHGINNSASQTTAKINGITALYNDIGTIQYEILPQLVKQELLKTSSDKSRELLPIPSEIVISFCKVCENLFRNYTPSIPKDTAMGQVFEVITKKTGKEVPVGLKTVNEMTFRSAVNEMPSSLGALTLVYIMSIKDNEKKTEEFFSQGFHCFISDLTGLRAHGNSVGLALSHEKITGLRTKLYDFIKFIGG